MARSSPLDLDSSRRSYHYFFKVFFPKQSSDRLRFPPEFREHIEGKSSGKMSLKGPSGSVWIVNLVKNSDGFFFEDGWKEFVADQSLIAGDFLVFRYDGNSKFTVLVFDSSACEKKKAFFARPSGEEETMVVERTGEEESVGKEEEGEEEELKALVLLKNGRVEGNSNRKRRMDDHLVIQEPLRKKKKQSQSSLDRSNSKRSNSSSSGRKASGALATPKRSKSSPNSREACLSPKFGALETPKRSSFFYHLGLKKFLSVLNGRKARLSPKSGALATPKRSKSSPNVSKVRSSPNSRALATPKRTKLNLNGKKAQLSPNSRALATVKLKGNFNSPSSSSKSSKGTPRQKSGKILYRNSVSSVRYTAINKKAKSEYQSGQGELTLSPNKALMVSRSSPHSSKMSTSKQSNKAWELVKSSKMACQRRGSIKVLRKGSLISQRRPVTEEEVGRTLQKALSFKSKHPFAIKVMQESYVYSSFFMYIPSSFAREHLPKVNTAMTLWDPNGKPWKITYISYPNRGALSGGWGKFSYTNNLEKHDVCVFELIEKTHLRVHIFRVVEKISPLLRNGHLKFD